MSRLQITPTKGKDFVIVEIFVNDKPVSSENPILPSQLKILQNCFLQVISQWVTDEPNIKTIIINTPIHWLSAFLALLSINIFETIAVYNYIFLEGIVIYTNDESKMIGDIIPVKLQSSYT